MDSPELSEFEASRLECLDIKINIKHQEWQSALAERAILMAVIKGEGDE